MLGYYKVFTETKPLREKLAEMRKIVQEKTEELKIKKDALDKVNKRIQELEDMFAQKMK
jgi:dynein heavy chain, axonemal